MKENMNIVISINSNYVMQCIIMLKSLFDNNENDFDVYLLHSRLEKPEIEIIENHFKKWNSGKKRYKLIVYKLNNEIAKKFPIKNHVTIESYYRLFIGEILPINISRVLYLDVDILVVDSIGEIYNEKLEENILFLGCPDKAINSKGQFYERLKIPEKYKYINAGVLLINLTLLRKIVNVMDIYEYVEKNSNELLYEDQDIINGMFFDRIKYLDSDKFNFIAAMDCYKDKYLTYRKNTSIIHFAGAKQYKPWNYGYVGKEGNLYKKYTQDTIYVKEITKKNIINVFFSPVNKFFIALKKSIKSIMNKKRGI